MILFSFRLIRVKQLFCRLWIYTLIVLINWWYPKLWPSFALRKMKKMVFSYWLQNTDSTLLPIAGKRDFILIQPSLPYTRYENFLIITIMSLLLNFFVFSLPESRTHRHRRFTRRNHRLEKKIMKIIIKEKNTIAIIIKLFFSFPNDVH